MSEESYFCWLYTSDYTHVEKRIWYQHKYIDNILNLQYNFFFGYCKNVYNNVCFSSTKNCIYLFHISIWIQFGVRFLKIFNEDSNILGCMVFRKEKITFRYQMPIFYKSYALSLTFLSRYTPIVMIA